MCCITQTASEGAVSGCLLLEGVLIYCRPRAVTGTNQTKILFKLFIHNYNNMDGCFIMNWRGTQVNSSLTFDFLTMPLGKCTLLCYPKHEYRAGILYRFFIQEQRARDILNIGNHGFLEPTHTFAQASSSETENRSAHVKQLPQCPFIAQTKWPTTMDRQTFYACARPCRVYTCSHTHHTDLFVGLIVQKLARSLLTRRKWCWCLLLTLHDKQHTRAYPDAHPHTQFVGGRDGGGVHLQRTHSNWLDLELFFFWCQSIPEWCISFLTSHLLHLPHSFFHNSLSGCVFMWGYGNFHYGNFALWRNRF